MSLAFVYAGQGSQSLGMGGLSEAQVTQTKYVQPAMIGIEIELTDMLKKEGIIPDVVCGLSLGEYAALYAADVWDAATTLDIVSYRGHVMQETTKGMECAMVAILGLVPDSAFDEVEISNYNCTGQIVISGEKSAVERAAFKAKSLGAKRCIPLNTNGPFHTSMMEEASRLLNEKFNEIEFNEMKIPVIANVTGEVLNSDIAKNLVNQVKCPVQFEKTIKTLEKMGVNTAIEIGPGRVISGFIKKTSPSIQVYNVEKGEDIACVKQQL